MKIKKINFLRGNGGKKLKGDSLIKMSSVLSPTSVAASRNDAPCTAKEFSEHIKYFQQTHKAIVRLTAELGRIPGNQSLKIPGGHTIRRTDLNKYSQAYISQLGELRKIFTNRKKKTKRPNSQLNSLFYISDQLVSFYKGANLGPLDPANPKGEKLADHIDVILGSRMATSGILTSLISRYIEANELKTPNSSGRFMPDKRMEKAFSTTKYVLGKKDLSKRSLPSDIPQEKAERIQENISMGGQSAFDRVSERVDRRSGKAVFDQETGLLYTTMMVFNNFFRIPPQLLTESERGALTDEDNIAQARELQANLSKITSWNHSKK